MNTIPPKQTFLSIPLQGSLQAGKVGHFDCTINPACHLNSEAGTLKKSPCDTDDAVEQLKNILHNGLQLCNPSVHQVIGESLSSFNRRCDNENRFWGEVIELFNKLTLKLSSAPKVDPDTGFIRDTQQNPYGFDSNIQPNLTPSWQPESEYKDGPRW